MQVNVQVSEDVVLSALIPAELGKSMTALQFAFVADTDEELERLWTGLGFEESGTVLRMTEKLQYRPSLPVTGPDGEQVGHAALFVHLGDALAGRKSAQPIEALERLARKVGRMPEVTDAG